MPRCPGRSVAACQNQIRILTTSNHGVVAPVPQSQDVGQPSTRNDHPSFSYARPLTSDVLRQPQQYQFAPINEPRSAASFQTATYPPGAAPDKSGKKRGRPSKAEREIREAEAAARGEVYQPTKRNPKNPRPSTEVASLEEAGEDPGSEKKTKKQKIDTEPMGPPTRLQNEGGPLSLSTTAAEEQMQIDTPERQFRSTIPETQGSDFSATSSLLPGLKEQAMRAEVASLEPLHTSERSIQDTVQSSVTLQQGPSTDENASASPAEAPVSSHDPMKPPEIAPSSA